MDYILEINHMSISFGQEKGEIDVIRDLSINLRRGEILSIVGASGSGKSVFSHALMGILPSNAICEGEVLFEGRPLDRETLVRELTLIPQTSSYLDPLMKLSRQIQLTDNELGRKSKNLYPFQCSGGMIRNALFGLVEEKDASVVIADEPTPGLDLETAVGALAQLKALTQSGKSVILITHDIDLAIHISDRVAVFYDGTILEIANQQDFLSGQLRHPYTRALFGALPQNGFQAVDIPPRFEGEHCFCRQICEKSDQCCEGKILFQEENSGMVRCNHVFAV